MLGFVKCRVGGDVWKCVCDWIRVWIVEMVVVVFITALGFEFVTVSWE